MRASSSYFISFEINMEKDSDRYFRSCSFPLVIFLYARDQQIAGINPVDNTGKKEFAFVKTPRLEELVDKYKFGAKDDPDIFVSVHSYEQARRELLDRLNDS